MEMYSPVPAKLLLFGEHSVLLGFPAITLPLHNFSARLRYSTDNPDGVASLSNNLLAEFFQYINNNATSFGKHLELKALQDELSKNLYLQSDIPPGYGLGSSASVCVALYKAFGKSNITDPSMLKDLYSKMESYFHGRSSGTDPLAVHVQKPLWVQNSEVKLIPPQNICFPENMHVYLLDSRIARNAAKMIATFQSLYKSADYKYPLHGAYLPVLEQLISNIVQGTPIQWESLKKLSAQQFIFFNEMIPHSLQSLWQECLAGNQTCIKILGAGGGGYFMVFSKEAISTLGNFTLKRITL